MNKKVKSNRQIKKEKIQALQRKKSNIVSNNNDKKSSDNEIDELKNQIDELKKQMNYLRKVLTTKMNKFDSFSSALDGALQDQAMNINVIVNEMKTTNDKVDGIMDILLEDEEDESKSDKQT